MNSPLWSISFSSRLQSLPIPNNTDKISLEHRSAFACISATTNGTLITSITPDQVILRSDPILAQTSIFQLKRSPLGDFPATFCLFSGSLQRYLTMDPSGILQCTETERTVGSTWMYIAPGKITSILFSRNGNNNGISVARKTGQLRIPRSAREVTELTIEPLLFQFSVWLWKLESPKRNLPVTCDYYVIPADEPNLNLTILSKSDPRFQEVQGLFTKHMIPTVKIMAIEAIINHKLKFLTHMTLKFIQEKHQGAAVPVLQLFHGTGTFYPSVYPNLFQATQTLQKSIIVKLVS